MKISRKTFLIQSGITAAGIALMPNALFAKTTKNAGLQLYSLRDYLPSDVKGVIEKVAISGYKEVETYGYDPEKGFWGLTPKEFKTLLKANGLTSPSGHYGMDHLFAAANYDELKRAAEAAAIVGQMYVTVPFLQEKERKTVDDFKRIVDKINKAAVICESAGLKLAYHNHDFEFTTIDGTYLYKELLTSTSSNVYFELDLYWAVRAGHDPVQLFKDYPKRFVMVHVKDMDKVTPNLNTEIGSGSIDFKLIINQAIRSGVQHFFVEQENFKIDPFQSIKQSADYVQSTLLK
ncbi:sugar phosphate isomerase/epimerase family protein [Solitalea canadensis]|uniref:Sugar phosphate isomerase/epimerase n=1 Tax=Solitalea canadensis (strain ATCC 29591 / DSM 3403 / JCM 21819 / LMG 8368 / NBRC 15130 / NCIMB 12057 / USAM 9D) TaxID=929556 RepID=H8KQ08_SOLCM|nr:sugar phosphate isomerase/epimerase [Solitalea canadensis]AFD06117.1 sugar phosphate isomerase/epimerase [Solitalea canadensis DSM 3403]